MRDTDIPDTLEELQHWFADIISAPLQECDKDQIPLFSPQLIAQIRKRVAPSPTLNGEERIGIYKQQYWWRLLTIMQDLFPTLVALFDYTEFNLDIAEPYLALHLPQSWNISSIGSTLPHWLEENVLTHPLASLLPKLAKIDLAYKSLQFAEVYPMIDFATLREDQPLFLQPCVLLFTCTESLFPLRTELLQQKPEYWKTHPLPRVKKYRKKKHVVLFRYREEDLYEEISPLVFELLLRFQKGAKLDDITELLEKCPDVVSTFQLMASRGWLYQPEF